MRQYHRRAMLRLFLPLALAWACPLATTANEGPRISDEAKAVFESARPKLLQLRVILKSTQSQSTIGSGFIASSNGFAITNWHVVSDAALEPEKHALEYVKNDGSRGPLAIVAVDVVNDLAVVKLAGERLPFLSVLERELTNGNRGYAIGNPHDLGLTIVEGTHNGHAEHSLVERLHFTGAINSGMSGGPAVTAAGGVFGVNVARRQDGQLVSFLVPAKHVRALLARAEETSVPTAGAFWSDVQAQLARYQAEVLGSVLNKPMPVMQLGPYSVPDGFGPFMRCWGRREKEASDPYESDAQDCQSQSRVFVRESIATGEIRFQHRLLRNRKLNALQFASLAEDRFKRLDGESPAEKEDYTAFRCRDDFVARDGHTLRAVLCVRGYRKMERLYDVRLKIATLDSDAVALHSSLRLGGVGFEEGMRLAQRYLEAVAWRK
jgi:serine protease Do